MQHTAICQLVFLSVCTLLAGCVVPGENYASVGCTYDSECTFDEFCYQSNCERALGREYLVTMLSAESYGTGLPDLSVIYGVSRDGEWSEVCETPTDYDTNYPTWNHACSFVISEGQVFRMEVWDTDILFDDIFLTEQWEGVDELVDLISNWGIELVTGNDSVDVIWRIDPLF